MGRFIGILIAVLVLGTAAVTLLSYLNTIPEDQPAKTATVTPHTAPPATPDTNPVHRTVRMYRHGVRPSLVKVGDVLFSWIGDFYQSNQAHFVDMAWTIFATVLGGLILQRMTRMTA